MRRGRGRARPAAPNVSLPAWKDGRGKRRGLFPQPGGFEGISVALVRVAPDGKASQRDNPAEAR
jgi:hypothetical protein